MRPTPAATARAITASRSASKSGKSRWQWLSTSTALLLGSGKRRVARYQHICVAVNDFQPGARQQACEIPLRRALVGEHVGVDLDDCQPAPRKNIGIVPGQIEFRALDVADQIELGDVTI